MCQRQSSSGSKAFCFLRVFWLLFFFFWHHFFVMPHSEWHNVYPYCIIIPPLMSSECLSVTFTFTFEHLTMSHTELE